MIVRTQTIVGAAVSVSVFAGIAFFLIPPEKNSIVIPNVSAPAQEIKQPARQERKTPPAVVKAVYATMYTAGNPKKMERLTDLIERSELNAVIIDVKGSGGELLFDILDVPKLISDLHKKGIHVIARVVAFQDSGFAKEHPEAMIHTKSGNIWRDTRGFAWVDPAGEIGRKHIIDIAKRTIDAGFDEINYDYIRFPSDGNLKNAVYPFWDEKTMSQADAINGFSEESYRALKAHDESVVLSMDIFGYTFMRGDDLGIGQRLEDLLPHFDYIYPMLYPSHYRAGNFGFDNPAEHPYEVIKGTIENGFDQLGEKALTAKAKIRPWLQAFNLGAVYTPERMKAQFQGTYDAIGEQSRGWLLWDPKNDYPGAEMYLEFPDNNS